MVCVCVNNLSDGETGYDFVGQYIREFWKRNIVGTVIVSLGTSYDGDNYDVRNEIATPMNFDDIEFLYDWWEGEKFIKIFGIMALRDVDVIGGIYPVYMEAEK